MHHTPYFTRYASTVWEQSRFSLPEQFLRCDGPHYIAVDYDIMMIYKHLCYLLHMRSSKVLANRDKKRFPSAGVNTRQTVKATRPPNSFLFFFNFLCDAPVVEQHRVFPVWRRNRVALSPEWLQMADTASVVTSQHDYC